MSESVSLPSLGESVTEGTVTRWLKKVGDRVEVDEPLLEVSTDKVDTEIPSPVAGVIEEILVNEDDTVEVGAALVRIGDGSGAGSSESASPESAPSEAAPSEASATDGAPEAAPEPEQSEEAARTETADAAVDEAEAQHEPVAERPAPQPASSAPAPEAAAAGGGSGDAESVVLPSLGESVTEGTITRWLKGVGDEVEVDEPLLEISTDKVDTEIPSPVAGIVQQILAAEDETVEVGAVLAMIGSGAAPSAQPPAEPSSQPAAQEQEPAKQPEPAPAAQTEAVERPAPAAKPAEPAQKPQAESSPSQPSAPSEGPSYVTPLVRRLAQDKGVDLSTVRGTGVGGRVRKEDVLKAAESAAQKPETATAATASAPPAAAPLETSPLRGTTQPMSRLRKVLADRAVVSMQSTAQLTSVVEVDVTNVAAFRDRVKGRFVEQTGVKLSFLPFFALAAAEALKAYPVINATVDGDQIVYPEHENLSIAVDTERGLLTPVVRDAADQTLADLAKSIADLAERTRNNKLKPDELAGGTFTLTNTGSRGALFDTPVVFLPQVAILGTGIVTKKPVVMTQGGVDAIAIRSTVYLALSYDHRIVDGADAARFLVAVKNRLEAGQFEQSLGI
ncbi:2-oxoglutarate dehydrogenase, E2 component, dihydrolipoamide succinyltransferase [Okibacterium endophyticum]